VESRDIPLFTLLMMEDILATLQAPPLGQIADIKSLQSVVLGLGKLASQINNTRRSLFLH